MTVLAWPRHDPDVGGYVMDNPWTIGGGRGWIGVALGVRNSQEKREQRFPAAPGCVIPTAF
jgi:hypothetical protein